MANISSPFGQNEWLVEEMYRKFRDDPSSVDPSWHEFLVDYNPESTHDAAAETKPAPAAKPAATKPRSPREQAGTPGQACRGTGQEHRGRGQRRADQDGNHGGRAGQVEGDRPPARGG
ncbi:hypothetical protein IWGMT90018_48120 [Mycobacterium kiyosense]|nr:hypothetical protein IWGMT90018_48120 [Mycobacterium kiyosense]